MSAHPRREPFRVGEWHADPMTHRLEREGESRPLEPLVMSVLEHLASRHGEVVEKRELMQAVWGGVVVSDNAMVRAIAQLRRALDDDWREPQYIQTISKKGYRLVADVAVGAEIGDRAGEAAAARPGPAPTLPRRWLRSSLWLLVPAVVAGSLASRDGGPPDLDPRPLTAEAGSEIQPALSADGRRVAFCWDGPAGDNWDVYVKRVGSESVTRLTADGAAEGNPAWSPDGKRIAFVHYGAERCEIRTVSPDGGSSDRLAGCSNRASIRLAWSPDGSMLAFNDFSAESKSGGLFLLAVSTREVTQLTFPPAGTGGDTDPAFAGDGRSLVFRRVRSEGRHDLYAVPLAGGRPSRLTFDDSSIDGHAWDAESGRWLFASRRNGLFQLWAVTGRGGEEPPRRVAIPDSAIHRPTVAAGRLVYQRSIRDTNLWAANASDGGWTRPRPLLSSTRWELHPRISPDGTRIAFSSDRSGSYEIWAGELESGAPVKLTAMGGPFTGTPRWSPDGRQLVFDSRPEGHADLFTVGADGGAVRRLTRHPGDDLAASWSRDGKTIFFTSDRSGSWQVWELTLDDMRRRQVTRSGGFGPQPSPDGRHLYFARPDADGLWRMPVSGGPAAPVLAGLAAADWGSWAVTRAGIYFLSRPSRLDHYDPATGLIAEVATPERPVPGSDVALSVASDGTWYVLGQIDRDESDLMLVESFRSDG